jgi:trimeric autotransporter adhesin
MQPATFRRFFVSTQIYFRKTQLAIALTAAMAAGSVFAQVTSNAFPINAGVTGAQVTGGDFTVGDTTSVPGGGSGGGDPGVPPTIVDNGDGTSTVFTVTDIGAYKDVTETKTGYGVIDTTGSLTLTGGQVSSETTTFDLATSFLVDNATGLPTADPPTVGITGSYDTGTKIFTPGPGTTTSAIETQDGGNLTMSGLATIGNGLKVTSLMDDPANGFMTGPNPGVVNVLYESAEIGVINDGGHLNGLSATTTQTVISGGTKTTTVSVDDSGVTVTDSTNGQTFAVNNVGDVSVKNGLTVGGATLTNGLTSTGAVQVNNTLGVTGLTSTAGIQNAGNIATDTLSTTGDAAVGGNATVAGNLGVTGATTTNGITNAGNIATDTLSTTGDAAVGGNATVAGNLGVTGATTTNGITNTGNLLSQSNDGTAGLEVINGSARMGVKNAGGVYNGIAIDSDSAAVGAANGNGDYSGLLVTGSSAVLAVASDDGSYHNYVMLQDEGVTINGGSGTTTVTVNNSGVNVNDSANGQTFAVNNVGDATVARDLSVGRNAAVAGTLTVTGATTLNGATTINNTLNVTGATTTAGITNNGTLTNNGDAVFTGSGGAAAVEIHANTSTRALDTFGASRMQANKDTSVVPGGVWKSELQVDATNGVLAQTKNAAGTTIGKVQVAPSGAVTAEGNGASMYVNGTYAELHNSDYNGLYVESNRSQLYGGTASSYSSLTLNGDGAAFAGPTGQPVRVTGVADGRNKYDAVNKRQLDSVEDKANAGVAAAVALAGIPSPAAGKQYSVGIGWGNYESENAFALGGKAQITPEFQLSAGWGYSNEGNAFNIGAGYSW